MNEFCSHGQPWNAYCRFCVQENSPPEAKASPPPSWPLNDPKAMESIERGLAQAKAGDLHYLGSFAEHAQESESPSPSSPGGLPEGVPIPNPSHHPFCSKASGPRSECHVCQGFDSLPQGSPEASEGVIDRIAGGLDLNGAIQFVKERRWVPSVYFESMLAEINALRADLAAARARIVELEGAAREARDWIDHRDDCAHIDDNERNACSCGFEETWGKLDKALQTEQREVPRPPAEGSP